MKKVLKQIFLGVIVVLVMVLITGTILKVNRKKTLNSRIETFPAFEFKALNDSSFSSDQIREGPVVIMFFNPECEHCQYQISALIEKPEIFSTSLLLLVSNADKNSIREFAGANKLSELDGIKILVDDGYRFIDYFGTESVPTTFIYDSHLKLVRYFQGEVLPETILKYILQDGQY
jgi:thiol-disulfide isomerase/thioredoxin